MIAGLSNCCTCGMGRCLGVPFSVHWTFWFNWVFQVVFAVIQYPDSWKYFLVIATTWGPSALICFLLHEFGHILRNRSYGGSCSYSMLWPLGGVNDCNITRGTCLQEFWVATCGPLMHIPQMFFWLIIMALASPDGVSYYSKGFDVTALNDGGAGIWFGDLAKRSLDVNIMVFFINMLLPMYPMDCARMVASLCVHCGMLVDQAASTLVIIGFLMGVACIITGIILLVGSGASGLFILLMGFFALWTSYSMHSMIKSGAIRQHPVFQPDCYDGRTLGRGLSLNDLMRNQASRGPDPNRQPQKKEAPPKAKPTNNNQAPPSPAKKANPNNKNQAPSSPVKKTSKPAPKKNNEPVSPTPVKKKRGPNNNNQAPKSPKNPHKKPLAKRGPPKDIETG